MKMRKLVTVLQAVVGLISRKAGQFFLVASLAIVPALTPLAASAEEAAIEEVVVTGVRGSPERFRIHRCPSMFSIKRRLKTLPSLT